MDSLNNTFFLPKNSENISKEAERLSEWSNGSIMFEVDGVWATACRLSESLPFYVCL